MILGYCILTHPGICIMWCWTTMRPARLVSYAFLYTTRIVQSKNMLFGGFHCSVLFSVLCVAGASEKGLEAHSVFSGYHTRNPEATIFAHKFFIPTIILEK